MGRPCRNCDGVRLAYDMLAISAKPNQDRNLPLRLADTDKRARQDLQRSRCPPPPKDGLDLGGDAEPMGIPEGTQMPDELLAFLQIERRPDFAPLISQRIENRLPGNALALRLANSSPNDADKIH
jgi:hypothetical protein